MVTGRGISASRRIVGGNSLPYIGEELRRVRTAGSPPTLQQAVVIEVIDDPSRLTDNDISNIVAVVNNPEYARILPSGAIIARIVSAGTGLTAGGNTILFPFFSSHVMLPVKSGETVHVIYEDYSTGGNALGFWLSRVHSTRAIEDPNYTHHDRRFLGELNPSNYTTSNLDNRPSDSLVPSFPNGGGTGDSVTIGTSGSADRPFEKIVGNSLAYALTTPEPVPRWAKRAQELVLQGSNNTLVVLGEDRSGGILGASGSNAVDLRGQAGTIDIVAGRGRIRPNPGDEPESPTACRTITNVRNNAETDKSPFTRSSRNTELSGEGNPDPMADAARILITQQSKADINFKLDPDADGGQEYPDNTLSPVQPAAASGNPALGRSYVVAKADHIRIIARKDDDNGIDGTVLIIRQGEADTDLAYLFIDNTGQMQIYAPKIFLGASKEEKEPYIKWTEYKKTVENLQAQIEALKEYLGELNTQLTTAFAGNAIPYAPIVTLQAFSPAINGIKSATLDRTITEKKLALLDNGNEAIINKAKSTKIFGE
jgi:hypothetical protein